MLALLALLALSLVGPATQAGSPRVICIQKSHKQRLTMVHLCASQRPHVGLKLFEDCFWVASTWTVVGRIWWQLTSRKGWVNGETIMCSKCCPCPPCALVGWVHHGHVSGSGNIFAFGAGLGWACYDADWTLIPSVHSQHQTKKHHSTSFFDSRVNPLKMIDWLVVSPACSFPLLIF